jgi:arylformamidase
MKLYDVTRSIHSGMAVYAGDPVVTIRRVLSIAGGEPANVSAVSLGSHTGTHVDAPAHFREGAPGVDALPLDLLIGPAQLYVLDTGGPIDVADLDGLDLGSCPRILFKTRPPRSGEAGGLSAAAAALLVQAGVRLVGLEGESADAACSADFPAHRTLLDAGAVILEGLDLSEVPSGRYEIFCLPLKLRGCDGAPARVVLRAPEGEPGMGGGT